MGSKREVCPTCQGKKRILCCSIDDNTQCETVDCPTCGGTGYIGDDKKNWKIIALLAGAVVIGLVLGITLLMYAK